MISGAVKRRGDEKRAALNALPLSSPSRPDTIEAVMADADAVFGYRTDLGYQDRAHRYLAHRGVCRDSTDTACLRVVYDLVGRAHRLGGPVGEPSLAGARRIAELAHEIDVTAYTLKKQLGA